MQKYSTPAIVPGSGQGQDTAAAIFGSVDVYLASDVDARIAELQHELDIRKAAIDAQFRLIAQVKALKDALREAMEWNWLEEDSPPPADVVEQCRKAIGL